MSEGQFLRSWLIRCGLAEFLGIGLAALAAVGLSKLFADPEVFTARIVMYILCLVVGALEGAMIGWAQGSLLQRCFPKLRVSRMMGWTALVAVIAWAMGMAPSTFFPMTAAPGASAPDPPLYLVMLFSSVGGAFGGALIGGAQLLEMRHHTSEKASWLWATVAGWAMALPLDMIGAMLPNASTPGWLIVASGAGFGLLAGVTFAIPTGMLALRWYREERARES